MPAPKIPGRAVATTNLGIGLWRCEIRVRGRQTQMEADLEGAWRHDPILLLEGKVTRWLRGKPEAVN